MLPPSRSVQRVCIELRAVSRFADGRVLRSGVSPGGDKRVCIELCAISRFADGRALRPRTDGSSHARSMAETGGREAPFRVACAP